MVKNMTKWMKGKIEKGWQKMIGEAYFCERQDMVTGRWESTGSPYTKEEAEKVLKWLKTNTASHMYSGFRVVLKTWSYWHPLKQCGVCAENIIDDLQEVVGICKRCDYQWLQRHSVTRDKDDLKIQHIKSDKPKNCSRCKSPSWFKPRA